MRASDPDVTAILTASFGPAETVTARPCWQVLKTLQYLSDANTLETNTQRELMRSKN